MSSDKLENIYKLLTEHNFHANKNVLGDFKCGKCRKILIKACQTQCGCRFCRSCVDEMMYNGSQFCPGITRNCKIALLSTAVIDYRVNNQISMLKMKCPQEMCSFECELLEMNDHLRICGKKGVECPFYKFGCNVGKVTNDNLIEHFQLENYNHNKTLIDMIENFKNEIEDLKEKVLKNHEEINKLKTDLHSKDEKIKLINAEIKIIKTEKLEMEKHLKNVEEKQIVEISKLKSKQEKEVQSIKKKKDELDSHMQIGLRNIWCKIDEFELELKKRNECDKIKSVKSELIEKIETLQIKTEITQKKEIKSINDEIKLKIKEVCKQIIDKSIMQMGFETKINQLERNVENKMNGIFEMMIDNIDELREKDRVIWSEYFYVRMYPYKLRLYFLSFGDEFSIYLYIYDDVMNQYLLFPFTADVTIKIVKANQREMTKSVKRYCQLEKPDNNSCNWSEAFIFSLPELTKTSILESNRFIVQCYVDLK